MTSMAVRGTIILLAAVALIAAVVALNVAQAQSTPQYKISAVSPDKVLEGDSVAITVEVTASPAPSRAETVHLLIANEDEGDFKCDFISSCAAPAKNAPIINGGDFIAQSYPTTVMFGADDTTEENTELNITPHQDSSIEPNEKIYLVLCATENCVGSNNASTLLDTASITIVGEEIWADNTKNSNTSTVALTGC